MAHIILFRTEGDTHWFSIVHGFRDHSILPTGGGKNGEWFGSDLPSPFGYESAISFGTISICILIFPFSSPFLSFISIQKLSSSS